MTYIASAVIAQIGALPPAPLALAAKDAGGRAFSVPAPGAKATAMIFLLTDCPIGNRLGPEMGRISASYGKRGVHVLLVYADPAATQAQAARHVRDYGLVGKVVLDKDHALVKAAGARTTPSAVVLDSKGRMTFRGRINDLFLSHGRRRAKPSRNDLRIALDETLAGKPVSMAQPAPIGCDIPPGP